MKNIIQMKFRQRPIQPHLQNRALLNELHFSPLMRLDLLFHPMPHQGKEKVIDDFGLGTTDQQARQAGLVFIRQRIRRMDISSEILQKRDFVSLLDSLEGPPDLVRASRSAPGISRKSGIARIIEGI